jgi:hypothetical protein
MAIDSSVAQVGGRRRSGKSRKGQSSKRAPRGRWNEPNEPDLLTDVRRAISDPNPLTLIEFVSALMFATDPRRKNPFEKTSENADLTLGELVEIFIGTANPETSALLGVIAELAADDLLRARIRRELATRATGGPAWLGYLSKTETYRAVRMHHVLDDGDNILLGVRMHRGYEFTCAVYIDHNVGTLVKDAFVLPESIVDVLAKYRELTDDPDTRWDEIDLADVRSWLKAAIDRAAITFPPFETETWPECRAMVEWVVRGLPDGGAEYPRPQWNSDDVDGLTKRFFASPYGRELDDKDHRDLLEDLLWYGTDYGPGDPMRWSAVRVEILLNDWIPRKIVAPVKRLAKAPALLRALIQFTHAEVGIRPDLTEEVLAAVDAWESSYQEKIRAPRLQGAEALLDAMGFGPKTGGDLDDDDFDEAVWAQSILDSLAIDVGGHDQLARLDAHSLPDEEFTWAGIAEDVRDRVQEVLTLTDRCCDELLDVEYRTACRRLLARAASGGPEVFRRKGRTEIFAAGVVWIIGKVNDQFHQFASGLKAKDLMSHFGLRGSVSQRAATLLDAAGFDCQTHDLVLGSTDYLVSAQRRRIIHDRDRLRETIETD